MRKTGISSVIPRQKKGKKYGFTAFYLCNNCQIAPLSPFPPQVSHLYMSMEEMPPQRLYGPIDPIICRE